MKAAVFEYGQDVIDVDDFRERKLEDFLETFVHMESDRSHWCENTDDRLTASVGSLGGRVLTMMEDAAGLQDDSFKSCTPHWFPSIGEMPNLNYYAKPAYKPTDLCTIDDMYKADPERNMQVVAKLRETDHGPEIHKGEVRGC